VNRALESQLVALVRASDAFSLIAFKGPVLHQHLYPDSHLRQYSDLDVLVPPVQVAQFVKHLHALGYVPQFPSADPVRDPIFLAGRELSFVRPGGLPTQLDLHWNLLPRHLPGCKSLDGCEQRQQSVEILGHSVPTLGDRDLFVYLCHHACKHGCDTLGHLYDLAYLLRRTTNVNWTDLLAEARADGLHRSLILGPYLAYRLIGASIPSPFIDEAERTPGLAEIVRLVIASMEAAVSPRLPLRRVQRLIWPLRFRVRFLIFEIFFPQPADQLALPAKPPWSYVYFLIRPVRLILREVIRAGRQLMRFE
jgi:hypothetical protein